MLVVHCCLISSTRWQALIQATAVLQEGLQQDVTQLAQQPSGQLVQQLPWQQRPQQAPGQLRQQSLTLEPAWEQQGVKAEPQATRRASSTAAYQALVSEEAQRMLRRASQDGMHFQAKALLRTPQHLVPLIEACKALQGLQTLDLSLNALSDSALAQLQDLAAAGVQLTSLDLSHNQFSSQAAASLCSIISHTGLSQSISRYASLLPALQHDPSSGGAPQVPQASAPDHLDAAAVVPDQQGVDRRDTAASAALGDTDSAASSSGAVQQTVTVASQQQSGGSQSRLAGAPSTSGLATAATGIGHCLWHHVLSASSTPVLVLLSVIAWKAPR